MAKRKQNAAAMTLGKMGWLKGKTVARGGRQARRDYLLTAGGQKVPELMRGRIREPYVQVVEGSRKEAKL